MDRLCDEVVQLIFYELADPGPLTLVSRRLHRFSQDPYTRAHYFLVRYGPTEALFHAFARGKLLTERVLDILLGSGAQLSRYLIQVAMHHYFYAQSHFIKTAWVRNVPLRVFTHFLKKAEDMYGEIPRGKGDDDGSIFSAFLKESRLPPGMRSVGWETIREILENYHFLPFCPKDPVMAQFPLALAIEPRLLPYAVNNGFYMDSKYRDFVFRKMFERPTLQGEADPEDIVNNVRELCRLDSTMFVSRTVAAEVCMEAKANEAGYAALKLLDKSGELRFELHGLVEDLIKTFIRTRSITNSVSIDILRYLYSDFPSSDPTARLVILITLFTSENFDSSPPAIHSRLETLGLTPITRRDVYNVMVNPFVDRYNALLDYAKWGVGGSGEREGTKKGMDEKEVQMLVQEVAARCLELACKGRFLKKLCEGHLYVRDMIARLILDNYQIQVEDVPINGQENGGRFYAQLSRDFTKIGMAENDSKEAFYHLMDKDEVEEIMEIIGSENAGVKDPQANLGTITQETLTTMIRHDEALPARTRRRMHYPYGLFDSSGRLPYPPDPLPIARWIKNEFGAKSPITAIFMSHAVINDNTSILHHYTHFADGTSSSSMAAHVPVTLKHFKYLARLGRAPNSYLYHEIESGAEFYSDEGDYVRQEIGDMATTATPAKAVKVESSGTHLFPRSPSWSGTRGKKRPRRTAVATVRSYAIPGSDDEAIAESDEFSKRPKPVETSLQRWIHHLGELAKEEKRKFKEEKRRVEMNTEPGIKVRMSKNEFYKSLSSHLRNLRRIEMEKRIKLYGADIIAEDYSDDDDGDVEYKTRNTKKRKTL